MKKRTYLLVLIAIVIITIYLFATGSPILTKGIFGIPFGNILLWLVFISLHLFFYKLNNKYQTTELKIGNGLHFLAKFMLGIALFWLVIAYILAGNIELNFSGASPTFIGSAGASVLHWNTIYLLTLSPFILSILYTIIRFIETKKNRT